jgi:ribosomal protein L7/L12
MVTLTDVGPSKLQVVKAVKEALGWGLKEAKDAVDAAEEAPSVFYTDSEQAQRLVMAIQRAGGQANYSPMEPDRGANEEVSHNSSSRDEAGDSAEG